MPSSAATRRMNGRQVLAFCLPARQGRIRRHRLSTARWRSCAQLEQRNPGVRFVELFNSVEYTEGAVSDRDGGADRGRGARGARRLPVPARLARDADLGDRHPALGDPDLLVHGADGLHAEQPDPARARAWSRACWSTTRSSRSRTSSGTCGWARPPIRRRSTPPTRSASPWSATTFSIVAVFLPVGLMPGISGAVLQEFRLHRGRRGADQPGRRAPDHADGRGLFPQGQGPCQAWRRLADGRAIWRLLAWTLRHRWTTVRRRLRLAGR